MLPLPAYAKKIAAFFILGMLLFIQAEKLLHRHNTAPTHSQEQVQSFQSSTSNCSICEFQISRDAQLADLEIPALLPIFLYRGQSSISSDYYYLGYSFLPARGPPALVL